MWCVVLDVKTQLEITHKKDIDCSVFADKYPESINLKESTNIRDSNASFSSITEWKTWKNSRTNWRTSLCLNLPCWHEAIFFAILLFCKTEPWFRELTYERLKIDHIVTVNYCYISTEKKRNLVEGNATWRKHALLSINRNISYGNMVFYVKPEL